MDLTIDALAGRTVIIGGGLAGLMTALYLAPEPVIVLAKAPLGPRSALVALDSKDFLDGRIGQYPLGIAHWPHYQARLQFIRRHKRLLDIVVRRRLLRGNKARAHVDAVGAERQRGDKASPIRHAARSHKRDLQLLRDSRQQDHIGNVVFARMAAALEPVDADRIAPDPLGGQRMTHRGAFVNDLDPVRLQGRDVLRRVAARGFDDPHAAFDDCVDVFRVGRRHE